MKILIQIFTIISLTNYSIYAQKIIFPTDTLLITGKITNPTIFKLADLDKFAKTSIKDLVIINHKGETKDTLTGLIGIPLKNLLSSIVYIYDKPKILNEFYFVFTASDGYKVVFSWNEIYNTDIGNNFFIVTQMKDKKLKEIDQRIIFISTSDIKTGRRYIKGLKKIEVKQLE